MINSYLYSSMENLMQNLKLSLLALAVMAVPGLKAASATPEKDTKAKAQTAVTQYVPAPLPEDRATFVQSMAQMTPPKEAHGKAQAWLVANPEVVNAALGNEPLIAGPSFRALHENTWKVLAAAGSPVLFQNANYVFRPFPGWIIKIGGHANRRYNLCPLTATDCVN